MAANKVKASDRQEVARKLVNVLKKHYKGAAPQRDLPVMETLMYACLLENVSYEQAEAAYERLLASFHDLNEIRVSSITELAAVLSDLPDAELRSLRILRVLQYVFEKHFSFEMESIRKKTLDLAVKQLGKIRDLSPFIRNYALNATLGAHLIPVDDAMRDAAVWLGLVEPGATAEHAAEVLKPAIRKPDAPQFCYLLRSLATDPRLATTLHQQPGPETPPEKAPDLNTAPSRLTKLLGSAGTDDASNGTAAAPAKKTAKSSGSRSKSSASKTPERKTTKKGTRASAS